MTEMTSSRPYILRAIHQWITDNGLTPHLLVNTAAPGVRVP
jgi:stringent starvation protein B